MESPSNPGWLKKSRSPFSRSTNNQHLRTLGGIARPRRHIVHQFQYAYLLSIRSPSTRHDEQVTAPFSVGQHLGRRKRSKSQFGNPTTPEIATSNTISALRRKPHRRTPRPSRDTWSTYLPPSHACGNRTVSWTQFALIFLHALLDLWSKTGKCGQ